MRSSAAANSSTHSRVALCSAHCRQPSTSKAPYCTSCNVCRTLRSESGRSFVQTTTESGSSGWSGEGRRIAQTSHPPSPSSGRSSGGGSPSSDRCLQMSFSKLRQTVPRSRSTSTAPRREAILTNPRGSWCSLTRTARPVSRVFGRTRSRRRPAGRRRARDTPPRLHQNQQRRRSPAGPPADSAERHARPQTVPVCVPLRPTVEGRASRQDDTAPRVPLLGRCLPCEDRNRDCCSTQD